MKKNLIAKIIKQITQPIFFLIALIASGFILAPQSYALSYELPKNGDTIVGKAVEVKTKPGETLRLLARRRDMGITEMEEANPGINPDQPLLPGTKVIVPSMFILPNKPWEGIVVNLDSYRLFYFVPDTNIVITYPVGIGKQGLNTPTFDGIITRKAKDPSWYVPQSVHDRTKESKGIELPKVMKPGKMNPLGQYALYTSKPTYLLHGTNVPGGVGAQVSSGCLRMLPEDIETMYHTVPNKTPITVEHAPYQVGVLNNKLYFEAHPLQKGKFEEDFIDSNTPAVSEIIRYAMSYNFMVNWDIANQVMQHRNSIPVVISEDPNHPESANKKKENSFTELFRGII